MNGCGCASGVKIDGLCYWCLKLRAGLIGSNGHGSLTYEQEIFVGIYGTPEHEHGWRSAASLLGWLERDEREPEARGITYSVSLDGTTWELSV